MFIHGIILKWNSASFAKYKQVLWKDNSILFQLFKYPLKDFIFND